MVIEKICGNCSNWVTDDGIAFCVLKDLYTETDAKHKCDEVSVSGESYFSIILDEYEKAPYGRNTKRKAWK